MKSKSNIGNSKYLNLSFYYFRNLSLIFLSLSFAGCSLIDTITEQIADATTDATTVIEDAIVDINRNSSNWQNVLERAIEELGDVAEDTVVRLDNVLNRTVAAAGAETRCSVDFLGDRVKEQLQNILAELKGEQPTPLRPQVCTAVPDNISAEHVPSPITHLGVYGYNFNLSTKLKAYIERADGSKRNVTSLLNTPTHYSMTLPFGATGASIGGNDRRILVTWNERALVSVGITQPPTPKCEIRDVRFTPSPITFVPNNHTRGDRDFDGNGPNVTGHVTLVTTRHASPSAVNVAKIRVHMQARETESDWTTVSGTNDFLVYSFPRGFRLLQRVTPSALRSDFSYTDNNHEKDTVRPGEGPARRLVITGDTDEDDVGLTKADVHFNEIHFKIKQVGDCI